jgi:hypothetical protein
MKGHMLNHLPRIALYAVAFVLNLAVIVGLTSIVH